MASIRRSLILYFLLLLGVALGGVALLMDQFAADFSRAREADGARRIETEYQYRGQEIEQRFNEQLEKQAEDLGFQLRIQYAYIRQLERDREWDRGRDLLRMTPRERDRERIADEQKRRARLHDITLPLAAAGGSPWSGLMKASDPHNAQFRFTLDDLVRWPQNEEAIRRSFLEPDSHAKGHPKYFLFQFPATNRMVQSPYPQHDLPPLPPDDLAQVAPPKPRFDDVTVNGALLRRVVLKSPLRGNPFRWWTDPTRTPQFLSLGAVIGVPLPAGAPQSAPIDRGADPLTFVYVHCARPKGELDKQLAEVADDKTAEQATLTDQTRAATTRLRASLAGIAVAAFVALAVGGWVLVGRGVSPIRKLSDAVSQVSEKDFRLPVAQEELSHELVPIHDRLTHTLDELRRAFEREKQAVADISHELRTPVAALLTTLDVTLRKPRAAEQYKQTLEECRTITRQLGQLVERVMTLAYLDAGQTRVSKSRVPAVEVVAGCATVIRPLAEARGLTFILKADPDVEVDTDRDKLREVLMNLLHNAVEYSNPGGSVELVVRPNGGGRVAFDVRDTGIGMTDDVKGKIFERFYRADPSRTETGVHAGLGLAIVKEYVERLGGSISVESAPGKGSLFRVELPAAADDETPKLAT